MVLHEDVSVILMQVWKIANLFLKTLGFFSGGSGLLLEKKSV